MPEIIPVFPLHTVLFPGGLLALKIFEARYLDMVSECLRHNRGFGVCLIRQGNEVGQAAITEAVGSYAGIKDFQQYPDGLLGITVEGQQRFRLVNSRVQPNHLIRAEIMRIEPEPACPVPARFQVLNDLISQLHEQEKITRASENARIGHVGRYVSRHCAPPAASTLAGSRFVTAVSDHRQRRSVALAQAGDSRTGLG